MNRPFHQLRALAKYMDTVRHGRLMFAIYVALSLAAALAEGMGLMLVVPLLENFGSGQGFESIAALQVISGLLDTLPPDMRLITTAAMLVFLMLLRGTLTYMAHVFAVTYQVRVQHFLMRDSLKKIFSLDIDYINRKNFGFLQNILFKHPERVAEIVRTVADMMFQSLLLLIYIILLVSLSWQATLGAVAFAGMVYLLFRFLNRIQFRLGADFTDAHARVTQSCSETLTSIRDIHLASATERVFQTVMRHANDLFRNKERAVRYNVAGGPVLYVLSGLFIGGMIFFNVVTHGVEETAWIGLLLMYILVLSRILIPLTHIFNCRFIVLQYMHAVDDLSNFSEEAARNQQKSGWRSFDGIEKSITINRATFSYPVARAATLRDVSLEIPAGKVTALVGPSGAGKTTVANMLVNFCRPDSGDIRIDGRPMDEFDVRSLRQGVGLVSQTPVLFDDTIANNLRLANPGADQGEIEEAVRMAQADGFINALENGYETRVGQGGVRLSGGQRQRIAVACMFLKRPHLLILDEVTSNLDTLTERALRSSLDHFRGKATVVVIAHRLAAVQDADQIVVMDQGRVVETGTHQSLQALNGLYARLLDSAHVQRHRDMPQEKMKP